MKRSVAVAIGLVALLEGGACRRFVPPDAAELAETNEHAWQAEEAGDLWSEGFFETLPSGNPMFDWHQWDAAWADGYEERLCHLSGADWVGAVFLVRRDDGSFRAVARRYKGTNEHGYMPTEENELPDRRLRPAEVETAVLDLDGATGRLLADACRAALTRRSPGHAYVADGQLFYAEHWTPGQIRRGVAVSPEGDSVAGRYVALGQTLWKYVRASAAARATMHPELVAKGQALSREVRLAKIGRARRL
jgi:hypothetical protein